MRVRICKLKDFALSQQSLGRRYFVESIKHKNCGVMEESVDVRRARVACGGSRQFGNKEIA